MSRGSTESVLRRTRLFAKLTDGEIGALCERVTRRHFGRGETLCKEGDRCDGLFIVAVGKIRISKWSPSRREEALAIEGSGGSFAELPLLDGGKSPVSATAEREVEVLFISRKEFQRFCREYPEVTFKILEVVGSWIRRVVGAFEDRSFQTVKQRLIARLVRMAEKNGAPTKRGLRVDLRATRGNLAAELGAARESVSRNLSRLEAEGLLEVNRRTIIVKELLKLKRRQNVPQ